jgi:hypothetical protein
LEREIIMSNTAYRWIMYLHNPLGNFDVQRVTSLDAARAALVDYGKATGFYQDLQVTGEYGCSGTLYPYSTEDWASAEEYREVGCPFDYPSKVVKNGPRGGVRVEGC